MVYLNIGKIIRKGKPRVIGGRKAVGQLANSQWQMANGFCYMLFAICYKPVESRAAEDLEIGINPGLALLNAVSWLCHSLRPRSEKAELTG